MENFPKKRGRPRKIPEPPKGKMGLPEIPKPVREVLGLSAPTQRTHANGYYRDRVAALHHDLEAAINLHRRRFPESSWADVHRALELTIGQIDRKLA